MQKDLSNDEAALRHLRFSTIDAFRRMQGDVLASFGLGPTESRYRVITSGPYWRLRDYDSVYRSHPVLIVAAPIKRPYIWDLSPSASAIRRCLKRDCGSIYSNGCLPRRRPPMSGLPSVPRLSRRLWQLSPRDRIARSQRWWDTRLLERSLRSTRQSLQQLSAGLCCLVRPCASNLTRARFAMHWFRRCRNRCRIRNRIQGRYSHMRARRHLPTRSSGRD